MRLTLLLAAVAALLTYITCKNLQKSKETPAPAPQSQAAPDPSAGFNWNASKVIQGDNPDAAYTHYSKEPPRYVNVPWQQVTPPSTSRKAYLASGWWYTTMAYQPTDTTVHYNYKDKWLKFKEDQTFEIYKDGQVIDRGNWGYDDEKKEMYISCKDVYYNNSWVVLERGFRMIWKGNTSLNVTGIQIRLDNAQTPSWQK